MKLEVGKYYKSRAGGIAGPIEVSFAGQPFKGRYIRVGDNYDAERQYNWDGTYISANTPTGGDLIAEWTDAPVLIPIPGIKSGYALAAEAEATLIPVCTCRLLLHGYENDCPYSIGVR